MIDIKAIRSAAEAAPTEGMWRYEPNGQTVWCDNTYMVADIRGWGHLQYLPNGKALQGATGVHIATANPSTVIALCDEVERLRNGFNAPCKACGCPYPCKGVGTQRYCLAELCLLQRG